MACGVTTPVTVCAQSVRSHYDITPQPLSSAIHQYTLQSGGQQVAYEGGLLDGRPTNGVRGRFTNREAIHRLLSGSGLYYRTLRSGVIVIFKDPDLDVSPPTAAPPVDKLPDLEPIVVVVTAMKRPRDLQKVPMAVSHVKQKIFDQSGVEQVNEFAKVMPSISVIQGDSPANSALSIRGMGTIAFSIAVEPSVLVQVDDVPSTFQARSFVDLNDLLRVEVLKGPQNALYGKSSTAGTINILTNNPSKTFQATAITMATSDDDYRTQFQVSGPLAETLFGRLALSASNYAGTSENLSRDELVNGFRNRALRGKLLWTPTPFTNVLFTGWYGDNRSSCCAYSYAQVPTDAVLAPDGGPVTETGSVYLAGITPGPANTTLRQDTNTFTKSVDRGTSLKVDHLFSDGYRLTSISSHANFRMDDQIDSDAGILPNYAARQVSAGQLSAAQLARLLEVEPRFGEYLAQGNVQFGTFRSKASTQEVRLQSPAGRLRYMLGTFFSDNETSLERARGPAFIVQRWDAVSKSQDADFFGQIDWRFHPDTIAALSARRQYRKIAYIFTDRLAGTAFAGRDDETASTYRLSLQRNFGASAMVYGALATGHKSKAYDLSSGFNQTRADRGPVEAESSHGLEVGLRTRIKGDGATINITAFSVNYDNFQSQAIDYDSSIFYLANVGKVRTRGLEIESSGKFRPHWRGTFSAQYLDAAIIDYADAPCFPGQTPAQGCLGTPGRQALKHRTLPNAPRWKLNLYSDYTFRTGPDHYLVLGGAYRWQSKTLFATTQDPSAIQNPYGVLNLSVSLQNFHGKYNLTVFVNNVFDQFYVSTRGAGGRTEPVSVIQIPARDAVRHVGLRLMVTK